MLVLLDETVQQVRVPPAKATSDSAGLGLHPVHEVAGGRVHANGYTGEHLKKMHGAVAAPTKSCSITASNSPRARSSSPPARSTTNRASLISPFSKDRVSITAPPSWKPS